MASLYPILKKLWWLTLSALVLGSLFAVLSERVKDFLTSLISPLSPGEIGLSGSLVALLLLLLTLRSRRSTFIKAFAVCEPTHKLKPEDLGYKVLKRGQLPKTSSRPHYPLYISRRATTFDTAVANAVGKANEPIEELLAEKLEEGSSLILIGSPLDGKSRTLLEVVRRVRGFHVVCPKRTTSPPEEAFSVLKRRRVVVLLDDLSAYSDDKLGLMEFLGAVQRTARTTVVAATCRDKPEIDEVFENPAAALYHVFQDIPTRLRLLPLTDDEKARLAEGAGMKWDEQKAVVYPTPGSITMEESMHSMKMRYQRLKERPELRDALRSISLLVGAGMFELTHSRIEGVLRIVFERCVPKVGDILEELAGQSFLQSAEDPVLPEFAYLINVVGLPSREQLLELLDVFIDLKDADGVISLGLNHQRFEKDFERAVVCFQEATRLEPDSYLPWLNLGASLSNLGRFEEAHQALDKALDLKPGHARTLRNIAGVLHNLERFEEALKFTTEALAIEPAHAHAHDLEGLILSHFGQNEQALTALEESLRLDSTQADAWYRKGIVLSQVGRPIDALEAFDEALRIEPDNLWAHFQRALTLCELGRREEALHVTEKVLELKPDFTDAWLSKGMCLAMLERCADAVEALDKGLTLDPCRADGWYQRGMALDKMNRPTEAIESLDQAVANKSDFSEAWFQKGRIQHNQSDFEGALNSYERCLEADSKLGKAWRWKGVVLGNLKRFQEAILAFDRAIELAPNDTTSWFHRGMASAVLDQDEEALRCFSEAACFETAPTDLSEILWHRGQILGSLGRYSEAFESCDEALRLKPDSSRALYFRAEALLYLQRFEEAVSAFDDALKVNPNDIEALHDKARALHATNQLSI